VLGVDKLVGRDTHLFQKLLVMFVFLLIYFRNFDSNRQFGNQEVGTAS
jgi:hypothetical protein